MGGMLYLDFSNSDAAKENMPQLIKRVQRASQDGKALLPAIDWDGSKTSTSKPIVTGEAEAEDEFGFDAEEVALAKLELDLRQFLEATGLTALAPKFVAQEVEDMETVLLFEGEADLKDLGLSKGARLKLWKAIKKYK